MKKFQTAAIVFTSCFLAVFGAIQASRLVGSDQPAQSVPPMYRTEVIPASYTPAAGIPDFRTAAKRVTQSVVTVNQYQQSRDWYSDSVELRPAGAGAGVIISTDGTIVTNNHVVQGAQEVRVRLSDNRSYVAKVVGTDRRSDIAVLKVNAKDLVPIEVGDSSRIEVGEWVMAVGNPLGLENTVSVGVVSSLGRNVGVESSVMTDAIQTDAAINPGNSGGALTNAAGQLVGINAAIAGRANIGIGFAIPINRVKRIVADIKSLGYARYAALGISWDPRHDGALEDTRFRQSFAEVVGPNPPTKGIIVLDVTPQGAAEKAGIRPKDVLISLDGRILQDAADMTWVLNRRMPGDRIKATYWSNGETKSSTLVLGELRGDR